MPPVATSIGTSDAVSYTCTCACSTSFPNTSGSVLLFYRYYANTPALTTPHPTAQELTTFHQNLCTTLHLGGKLRFAAEGFNITIGGTAAAIETYITACISHWSFAGVPLELQEQRDAFFKPTPGCACVFAGKANVKVAAEITPLGVTDYVPRKWSNVVALLPEVFHQRCLEDGARLVDVRNHYESRIGYFINGEGVEALRPQIRRFSQWPAFVRRKMREGFVGSADGDGKGETQHRQVLTYCTGGIRCEKGSRWMQEALSEENENVEVFTLQGGIAAYLTWMGGEIKAGRKTRQDSLFVGRNYVFDARGSTGLEEAEKVANCHGCGRSEDRLGKCASPRCHLVLVICESCETNDVKCCEDCGDAEAEAKEMAKTKICACEREREKLLWGEEGAKVAKTQGWKRARRKAREIGSEDFDIRVQTFS